MENKAQMIDRKYRIVKSLGEGGFSEVLLVEGPQGPCALKLLKGQLESLKKSALEEFKNEFAILKDMRHPNIASILDFGFDEKEERYYYTSELIDGRDFITATEGMPLAAITDLFVQALRALAYLHSFRVYHFDIKAANVLVVEGEPPSVRIIDFGLAGIDPRQKLIGTPSYMSPEVIAREAADGRADLYSLGVLWYAAVTRQNPFRSTNRNETMERQLRLIPPPPSQLVSTIPGWLDAVILRLLEKNPADRFQSASAVIREINRQSGCAYPLETRETLISYVPAEGRFVGRAEELASIETDLARLATSTGVSGGCLVEGELGTGKTRLLREVKYRSQLKEIRVAWASAAHGEDFEEWCVALAAHVAEGKGLKAFILDDAQEALSDEVKRTRLLPLILRARRPAAAAAVWIALAARPISDASTRASLAALLQRDIRVGAFSREQLGEYLASLTGLASPPEPLLAGLFERTEGNPLFVTELVKSLIENGSLFDERGRWNASLFEDIGVDFSRVVIPGTVSDLLLRRTRSLSADATSLLEALAVSSRSATAHAAGVWAGVADPWPAVRELLQLGLLDRQAEFALAFHNALLGQALVEAMPPERRQQLHDAIARELRATAAPPEDILEQESQGSDAPAATAAAFELGEKALHIGHGEQAALYYRRALARADAGDVERQVELSMKLGEALLIGHDYAAATEQFAAVEKLIGAHAEEARLARWRIEMLVRLGGTFIKLQQFDRARAALHDARNALAAAGGDAARELTIENFLGSIRFFEGELADAQRIFEATRERAQALPEGAGRRITNNDLGMVLIAKRELDAAAKALAEDLARAEELGDDLLIGRAHYNLAQLAQTRGAREEAIASYNECVEVCRRSQNTELLLRAYNGLGNVYQAAGDPEQSLAFYERGLALHERIGDLRGGAAIAVNMGVVESQRGRNEAALDHLVPAVDYLRSLPTKAASDWTALSRGLLELGDLHRKEGRLEEARGSLEEARRIATRVLSASSHRFWILATLAEVSYAQGRAGELADLLRMLAPLATGEAERAALADLTRRLGTADAPVVKETTVELGPQARAAPLTSTTDEMPPRAEPISPQYLRILSINKLIVAESDLGYVLKTVLYYALDLSSAEAGAVLLLEDDGEITVACQRNMEGREDEIAWSRSLARRAIQEAKPLRSDDATADDRFAAEPSVCLHRLRSILCLPVRARGRVIGVLYLDHRYRPGVFASADMTLLEAFADQVGLAIESARRLKSAEEREAALADSLADARRRAEASEAALREAPQATELNFGTIAARSVAMRRILRTLDKVADTDIGVFLCGESGTGKELVARALHANHSRRCRGRFVAINCGAIPETLIESELFGYRAGAFTGAARDKKGLLEEASGGTLFLDEAGELPLALQVKLLRALQERECTRLGDTKPVALDLRVIAASNRDIDQMVKEGSFREDLFYRLCQIKVEMPPLRSRPEDLPMLAERFIEEAAPGRALRIHPALLRRFLAYAWPGNVRELMNVIQVSVALAEGNLIDERALPPHHPLAAAEAAAKVEAKVEVEARPQAKVEAEVEAERDLEVPDAKRSWADHERRIIAACFAAHGFRAKPAAAALGIAVATLYKRLKAYGLEDRSHPAYREPSADVRGRTIADCQPQIFAKALAAAGNRPRDAIANLRVSQGYFYKVIKRAKRP
jgi:serine/threonine-protein kinase PknK